MNKTFKFAAPALAAALLSFGLAQGAQAQATTASPPASATALAPASGKLAGADQKFLQQAAVGGMAEVELGQLAQQKAENDAVKQFGARMVQDHGKANDELKQLASSKGATLPSAPDHKHQQEKAKLEKLSGAAFDRAYMKHMLDDHKKDVSQFRSKTKSAKDADVKAFATKTLPTLEEHLKLAQDVNGSLKGSPKGAAKKASGT
jgi:putative membrane protein